MRTFISFRVNRFIRIGVPVNLGSGRALSVPPWLALLLGAVVVALIFMGQH